MLPRFLTALTITAALLWAPSAFAQRRAKPSSFAPTQGPPGTIVTLSGHDFDRGVSVLVGGEEVPVNYAPNALTFIIPRAPKNGAIALLDLEGGRRTPVGTFTIQWGPSISVVTPVTGPPGTRVVLQGNDFQSNDDVFMGTTRVEGVQYSPKQLVFNIPQGAVSSAFRVVRNATMQETTSKQIFTVSDPLPQISTVSPLEGGPGTQVTFKGAYITGDTRVTIGNRDMKVLSRQPTYLVAEIPNNLPPGSYDLFISVPRVRARTQLTQRFSVVIPVAVTSISPVKSSIGTKVTITGTNLSKDTVVTHNGQRFPVRTATPSKIVVQIPVGAAGTFPLVIEEQGSRITTAQTLEVLPPIRPGGRR